MPVMGIPCSSTEAHASNHALVDLDPIPISQVSPMTTPVPWSMAALAQTRAGVDVVPVCIWACSLIIGGMTGTSRSSSWAIGG